jgi:hypothetical protein
LRFTGCNPIEYIPYRTYIRLVKTNCLLSSSQENQTSREDAEMFDIKSNWLRL